MEYNKTDFEILYFLEKEDLKTEFKSCTVKTLSQEVKFSESKIRVAINYFLKDGFIKEGIKQGQAKTYFITEEGINKLKELVIGGS